MSKKPDLSEAVASRLAELGDIAGELDHLVSNGHDLPAHPLAGLLVDLGRIHGRLQKHRHVLAHAAARTTAKGK